MGNLGRQEGDGRDSVIFIKLYWVHVRIQKRYHLKTHQKQQKHKKRTRFFFENCNFLISDMFAGGPRAGLGSFFVVCFVVCRFSVLFCPFSVSCFLRENCNFLDPGHVRWGTHLGTGFHLFFSFNCHLFCFSWCCFCLMYFLFLIFPFESIFELLFYLPLFFNYSNIGRYWVPVVTVHNAKLPNNGMHRHVHWINAARDIGVRDMGRFQRS